MEGLPYRMAKSMTNSGPSAGRMDTEALGQCRGLVSRNAGQRRTLCLPDRRIFSGAARRADPQNDAMQNQPPEGGAFQRSVGPIKIRRGSA